MRKFGALVCVVMVTATAVLVPVGGPSPVVAARTYRGGLRAAIDQLPVRAETPAGYARSKFPHWIDANGDGQNTRTEVLIHESKVRVRFTDATRTQVARGRWRSWYDGRTRFVPSRLGIDHVVPLREAWESGADRWNRATRRRFANDLRDGRTLVAVTRKVDRAKGDGDPAAWLPPRSRCRYVKSYVAVKVRWGLSIDAAEKHALHRVRRNANCRGTITVTRAKIGHRPAGGGGDGDCPPADPTGCVDPPAATNPIVAENQKVGSTDWRIPWAANVVADDVGGQIKGYFSATSADRGETVTLHVSVEPAQTFTVDLFRIGWYGGAGGRLVQHVGPLAGVQQPPCPVVVETGLIECRWPASTAIQVGSDWTSGVYLAVLTSAAHYQNYAVLVVRDDASTSALLYQQPVTTYQAYNRYPDNAGGMSLYRGTGAPTVAGGRAVQVSFDRPYHGNGSGDFLRWEVDFIRWMEAAGYDVTYSTSLDTHRAGARILQHAGFVSSGHDEYWSWEMYDAADAAAAAGMHLAFFGANNIYWQVRFEPSSTGIPDRVMVCYKSAQLDPVSGDRATVLFRDVGHAEQRLLGIQYGSVQADSFDYVVANSSNWVYEGTGFTDGTVVEGLVGYESDRFHGNYPAPNGTSHTLLSASPIVSRTGAASTARSSVYRHAGGGWVFTAGTIKWSWGLDDYPNHQVANAGIQRTTANVLDRFVGASS